MRKIIVLGGALASLVILSGCNQVEGTAPKVETPPLRGTVDETPDITPEAPVVPEFTGDIVFDSVDPTKWNTRDGSITSADTGLAIKLADRGAALVLNNKITADAGDFYSVNVVMSSTEAGRIRARLESYCGRDNPERAVKVVAYEPGVTEFSFSHTFEFSQGCARLRLEAVAGPVEFEIQKIRITREAG